MILVRDVFRLKFGKAKEMKALLDEAKGFMDVDHLKNTRTMFDLTGPAYTMVFETQYNNLSEFEKDLAQTFGKEEWGQWYSKVVPLVEESRREVYTLYM